MTNKFNSCEKIVRRKAKRIERAHIRLIHMKNDVENLNIEKREKEQLLKSIGNVLSYLQNDDMEENKYNYDNFNG